MRRLSLIASCLLLAAACLFTLSTPAPAQLRVTVTPPPVAVTAAPAPTVTLLPMPAPIVRVDKVQAVKAAEPAGEVVGVEVTRRRALFHPAGSPVRGSYLAEDGSTVTVEDRVPFRERGPVRRALSPR